MVLEESSTPPSPSQDLFTNDHVPPSDGNESDSQRASTMRSFTADSTRTVTDAAALATPEELQLQYRVNGGPLRLYQIPFDRMPVQGITRSAAFGSPERTSFTSHYLVDLMTAMEAFNGRPLTQAEAEGMALHVGRRQVYTWAAAYGGVVAGIGWALYKRKTFKFPFRKAKPLECYHVFPFQRAPLLTGRYARAAWHITRGMAYVGLSWSLSVPICDYMGRSTQAIHMARDERTRALTQEFARSLQKAQREIQDDLKGKIGQSVRRPRGQGAPNRADSESSGDGEYYGDSQGGYVQDDNSPASFSQYPYSDTSTNTGILSDAQTQSRTRSQRSSPSSSDPSNRSAFDLEKAERQPRTFDSEYSPPSDSSGSSSPFFDDASPTAGNAPYSTSTSSSPGSAWARIRQSANSPTPPSPNPPSASQSPPTGSSPNKRGIIPPHMRPQSASARQLQQKSARDGYETGGDSFTFSNEVQERQLAKEQAQREFDRMLEAERRGEEGGAGGAGGGGGGGGGESAWSRRRGGS